jgi:hypothetical protein
LEIIGHENSDNNLESPCIFFFVSISIKNSNKTKVEGVLIAAWPRLPCPRIYVCIDGSFGHNCSNNLIIQDYMLMTSSLLSPAFISGIDYALYHILPRNFLGETEENYE